MALWIDIAKNLALGIPPVRRFEAKRHPERCGADSDTAGYASGVFAKHREAVASRRAISGRVLEIGPGPNVATSALFLAAGATEATCIDIADWRAADASAVYAELGLDDAVLNRITYVCPCSIEEASFPSESFDVVFSQAAFQKFRDPAKATMNIARMLRPDGVTTHQIDLRDNRDFTRPLAFLEMSDLTWRLTRSNRSPTNRWRASDIVGTFEDAGLSVLAATPTRTIDVSEEESARFAPRFRSKRLDDLGVLGLFVVAQKVRT